MVVERAAIHPGTLGGRSSTGPRVWRHAAEKGLRATRWAAGRQVRAAVRRRRAGGRRASWSSGDRAFGSARDRCGCTY